MARFTGKKALVIGGSRGIGASIVQRLAGEGASVTFTYAGSRDAAEALAAETGSTAVRSDASNRDALIATVSEAGAIDILVVSAGLLVTGDPLELDPDAIDRMIDVNVRAPYFASVEAARSMPEGGRIIVIGSTNGDRMPFAGGAAYALTKSAIQGMARGLARDFGPRGITVNVVQPGPVDTEMNPADGGMAEALHGFMALPRHGKPDEIANLVAWLASEEAGFVTAGLYTIDGGFAA
ncbi:SDR family oxidoreductase [Novosphingobium sp. ST904]|uniref:SDR family oxidoreductase n=1 Tax=Novosphingobium sp. ST904 TaxID=1684385 RepID=UPI0006C859F4|nr:SDR family oxidoreductase [Novosphingobium sp. ST904]KPH66260.1 oxidoreductase [Novosphingobium sp. ST904]TCM38745.1 cyclic-di-GMP-binding biofilm dispersal mediator protein [Novosphingobium sp. ST904]